jgi:class 3 adenylate cyclase
MAAATRVVAIPTETSEDDNIPFEYLKEIVLGAGLLEADRHATGLLGLAVLEPGRAARPGGTADTVAHWRAVDVKVRTIAIQRPEADIAVPVPVTSDRHLRAMLFSDMVGYSSLSETNVRAFPRHFLGMVRELLDAGNDDAEFCNTWGDGLFLGFRRWDAAARFALDLRERVAGTRWSSLGLPAHTDVRMGMHGGPIFKEWDPVLRKENYFGSHVVRAARIEPIAAPGAIWLTEEMACLLASMRTTDLSCEYLGNVPLAKGYGKSALYALERGNHWLNTA